MTRHEWIPHSCTARRWRGGYGCPSTGAPAVGADRPGASQVAAWAFLAPVTIYLFIFYAYPLYRSLDLSLRNYTVRSFVQGARRSAGWTNYRIVFTTRRSHRRCCTR